MNEGIFTSHKEEIYSPDTWFQETASITPAGINAAAGVPVSPFGEYEQTLADAIAQASNGAFYGVQEHYPTSMTIDAKIIEVTETAVTMECLIVPSERVFQERTFDRALLEGVLPIKLGQFVQIRIFQKPGKIVHAFFDGSKRVKPERFEYQPMMNEEDYLDFEQPSS